MLLCSCQVFRLVLYLQVRQEAKTQIRALSIFSLSYSTQTLDLGMMR
jgi:hypothetical protein